MIGLHFGFALFLIADRDPASRRVDQDIGGSRKHGALLDVVVADEAKGALLRKGSNFIVDRSIFEVKDKMGHNARAANHLDQIARREQFALRRAQGQKTVERSLFVAHRYRIGRQRQGMKQDRSKKNGGRADTCKQGVKKKHKG